MFVPIFRDGGRRREPDDEVETLDIEALRARIGERAPRAPGRPPEERLERIDGPRPSQPRSWRDAAGI